MKILIVDDDPFLLKLLTIQLRSLQLRDRGIEEVVSCERAQQALDLLAAPDHDIGLLFCDLKMPEVDGVEFLRHLAGSGYRGGVVLVSGAGAQTLQTVRKLALARGLRVLEALEKPVSQDRLLAILQSETWGPPGSDKAHAATVEPLPAERLAGLIDSQQVIVHYQPTVSVASGEVLGYEALARLPNEDGELLAPAQFLKQIADVGLGDSLGWQVAYRAASDLHGLLRDTASVGIALNVTHPAELALDFPDRLCSLLDSLDLPYRQVSLELAESGLGDGNLAQFDVLARLQLKGFRLCLDQFGTGYSSLTQLRDLPLAEIKLDRGFVHGAADRPQQNSILEASIALARDLDLRTVAMGVESQADWDAIRALGCDGAQGFLIGRPMPVEDLPAWGVAWPKRHAALQAA